MTPLRNPTPSIDARFWPGSPCWGVLPGSPPKTRPPTTSRRSHSSCGPPTETTAAQYRRILVAAAGREGIPDKCGPDGGGLEVQRARDGRSSRRRRAHRSRRAKARDHAGPGVPGLVIPGRPARLLRRPAIVSQEVGARRAAGPAPDDSRWERRGGGTRRRARVVVDSATERRRRARRSRGRTRPGDERRVVRSNCWTCPNGVTICVERPICGPDGLLPSGSCG